jgi:DNA-binding winged helix-turn-helix (wHTH) protein
MDAAGKPRVARYAIGPFVLDTLNGTLTRDGRDIPVSRNALELLYRFLRDPPRSLITKETLLADVWPGVTVGDSSLFRAISDLREALGDTDPAHPVYIETRHRKGYCFIAEAVALPDEAQRAPSASPPPTTVRADHAPVGAGPALPRGARSGRRWAIVLAAMAGATLLWFLVGHVGQAPDASDAASTREYGFESGTDNWRERRLSDQQVASTVDTDCASVVPAHAGRCALTFQVRDPRVRDVYVSVEASDVTFIQGWVNVKEPLCTAAGCSTARIIVWDQDWRSYEGPPVELRPGWKRVCLDLPRADRRPLREIGVHLFVLEQSPPEPILYVDSVTTTAGGAACK